MRSDSDINLATLLLLALLAALCAARPADAYRTLAGLTGGAGRAAARLFY